jgi:type II secretory pathway component PulF
MRWSLVSMLPIIGPLSRWLSMASLCRLLALLVQQQVPLPEALRLSADVVRDPLVRREVHRASRRVAEGQSMPQATHGTRLPATFVALPGWSESAPLLASSLVAAAELFESQADSELKLLRAVAPALAFLTVLLVVGFLISSTMSPLIKIIETLT